MNTTPSSARSNALWSGAASVAGPAAQLLAAPYLIRTLGKEAYSVLLLVNSVISMSGLTTFGLSDATIKFVAEFAAEGRKDAIIGLLRTTLFLYLVLGAITAVGLSLASHFLATWLFNVGPDLIEPAALAIRIGACAFAVRLAYSVGGALCRGLRRYDLESRTGVATSLGVPGLSCLLVYQGYGFTAVILANLAVVTVTTCVLGVLGSRVLGTSRWLIPACGWEDVKRLLSYGMFSWLQMLEYVLCSQADRFIISARLGAEAVAPYAIIVQVTQLASGVVAQAFSYLFPTATEYHVKQRWADLNRLFLSGMLLTSIASLAIAALLFVYGQTVLFLWMGNSLGDYDRNLMLVLASSAALMGTTITPFYLLNGAGFVRLNTVFTMSSMLAVLPCSFLFIRWVGVVGMGLAKMMNVFPGLVVRAVIGRLLLQDRRIMIGLWQLVPTVSGLAVLWGSQFFFDLPARATQQPFLAFGTVALSIAVTSALGVFVFRSDATPSEELQSAPA